MKTSHTKTNLIILTNILFKCANWGGDLILLYCIHSAELHDLCALVGAGVLTSRLAKQVQFITSTFENSMETALQWNNSLCGENHTEDWHTHSMFCYVVGWNVFFLRVRLIIFFFCLLRRLVVLIECPRRDEQTRKPTAGLGCLEKVSGIASDDKSARGDTRTQSWGRA